MFDKTYELWDILNTESGASRKLYRVRPLTEPENLPVHDLGSVVELQCKKNASLSIITVLSHEN